MQIVETRLEEQTEILNSRLRSLEDGIEGKHAMLIMDMAMEIQKLKAQMEIFANNMQNQLSTDFKGWLGAEVKVFKTEFLAQVRKDSNAFLF